LAGAWHVTEWGLGFARWKAKPGVFVFQFTGDQMVMKKGLVPDPPEKYKIKPSQTPKEIDFIVDDDICLGIYKVDGDDLVICWGAFGDKERPRDFKTDRDGLRIFFLKRDKK